MRVFNKKLYAAEDYGGEFSVHNAYNLSDTERKEALKTKIHTIFLIALSAISLTFWIISLNILPFGHIFQYLLGSAVLSINILVFKWVKLF
ncbi:hypothetical protein [Pedobacter alpinus]|uniref:2TM domain-containing protein n=1 Tax=Pedobacter alpinus TaxID=1590643 RepID=A0ABW5TU56_9SPHI